MQHVGAALGRVQPPGVGLEVDRDDLDPGTRVDGLPDAGADFVLPVAHAGAHQVLLLQCLGAAVGDEAGPACYEGAFAVGHVTAPARVGKPCRRCLVAWPGGLLLSESALLEDPPDRPVHVVVRAVRVERCLGVERSGDLRTPPFGGGPGGVVRDHERVAPLYAF